MAENNSLYSSLLDDDNAKDVPTINYNDVGTDGYGQLVYPRDLFDSNGSYANAYTAFFISFKDDAILDASTYADSSTVLGKEYNKKKRGSSLVSSVASLTQDDNGKTSKKTVEQISATVVGGATGAFIGSLIGKFGGNSIPETGVKVVGAVGGGYLSGRSLDNVHKYFDISPDRKTQKACICLPTPAIVTNYEINWSEETNKLIGGIISGGAKFLGKLKDLDITDMATEGGREKLFGAIGDGLGNSLTTMALSTPMFGTALGIMSRTAPNPRKEQLFRDVGMREFNISYIFAPRSEAEAKNVESIITQFKYHAHPSLKNGDDGMEFLLNYPSEFDIIHYHNGKRNTHLPKHTTSVLKRVSVDYSNGNENFTFFENGMPTIIKMDLTFAEIAMLTKEDIIRGY